MKNFFKTQCSFLNYNEAQLSLFNRKNEVWSSVSAACEMFVFHHL